MVKYGGRDKLIGSGTGEPGYPGARRRRRTAGLLMMVTCLTADGAGGAAWAAAAGGGGGGACTGVVWLGSLGTDNVAVMNGEISAAYLDRDGCRAG